MDDAHAECVSCLGKSHADSALSGTDCSHCENFSLASLCARIAFFSENDCSPRPPDRLGSGDSEILPNNLAERGRVRVSLPRWTPQAASIVSLAAHYRKYFLPTISVLPLCSQSAQPFHPLATAVSSPCHTGQGLAGHPRRVNVSNDYGKTRLFTPIRSKTTTRFRGVLATTVRGENAHVLHAEVMNLLEKGAIEIVPPAQSESGFYSCYFLVPKKDGSLRPILDLRFLNHPLMKILFRMIILKQILPQLCAH